MATVNNVCDSANGIKKLIMLDGCFSIQYREKILAELCCLDLLAYPLDGFERKSEKINADSSIIIFDNDFDLSPTVINDYVYSGAIIYVHYPTYTTAGDLIDDANKNVIIRLGDRTTTFDIPIYNFYSHLSNPITNDNSKWLNSLQIINQNGFYVNVEILTIKIPKDGVDLTAAGSGC